MKMKCADVIFAKFMNLSLAAGPIAPRRSRLADLRCKRPELVLHFAQLAPHHPHIDHEGQPDERIRRNHQRRRRQLFAGRDFGNGLEFGLTRCAKIAAFITAIR